MSRILTLCLVIITLGLLCGCAEEVPAPPPAPKKIAAPQKPVAVEEEPAQEEEAPPAYVYDPSGRRDPFLPLFNVRRPVKAQAGPVTPLQKFDLGQFRLIAIIVGKGEARAMVNAPDGKSYILKRGVKVGKNDGVVTAVKADRVLVQEKFYDYAGEITTSTQEIQLPKREGA